MKKYYLTESLTADEFDDLINSEFDKDYNGAEKKWDVICNESEDTMVEYLRDCASTYSYSMPSFYDPGSCDYEGSYNELCEIVYSDLQKLFLQYFSIDLNECDSDTKDDIVKNWIEETVRIKDERDFVEYLHEYQQNYNDDWY